MSDHRDRSHPSVDLSSKDTTKASKNVSPTRVAYKPSVIGEKENTARYNPHTSPTRPSAGTVSLPSAAAVQRALAVAKATPNINDSSSDTARERKYRSSHTIPQWPTSPRLKSPPPSSLRSITDRMGESDHAQSMASARRVTTPATSSDSGPASQVAPDSTANSNSSQTTLRPPGRGLSSQGSSLATVAENSVSSSSSPPLVPASEPKQGPVSDDPPNADSVTDPAGHAQSSKDVTNAPTGEVPVRPVPEKAETVPAPRAPSSSRLGTNLAKRSITSLGAKNKSAVEPLRTITVETEQVNSNTQLLPDRGRDGGSIRTRASNETIRPKKDKKKPSRKAPSVHAGMNSSKADIFEAKVASAVGEADSSDSDETFVYESNPPDSSHTRHHSRTPSANSLASQIDQQGARGKHGVRNNGATATGKKSMKFSNSIYGSQLDPESAGDGRGSARGSARASNNTARHHHIGRHGRNGHGSIIDTDSPFAQTVRASSPRTPVARTPRPDSPRTSSGRLHFSRKSGGNGFDAYDDAADDERAPLMGSVRINRNRHSRRPNSSHLRPLHFVEDESPGCWPRYRGCFWIGLIVSLVFIAVTIFVVLINKDLENVKINAIQNVLASEQTLMLDLQVQAVNPNLFTITVSDMDINLFAESPYVGTTAQFLAESSRRKPSPSRGRKRPPLQKRQFPIWLPPFLPIEDEDDGGDDSDPDYDPTPGSQKMLLGRIFMFDSALVFPPSPLRRISETSVGEIRVTKPGNKTEVGGSARWERVLQHPFTIIVRGVLKYQLPLSSSIRSAKIGGRVSVTPGNSSSDGNDSTNTTITTRAILWEA